MNFEARAVGSRSKVRVARDASDKLSMYANPPQEELSLDEFELYALDRLQLLRGIELAKTRYSGQELEKKVKEVRLWMPLVMNINTKHMWTYLSFHVVETPYLCWTYILTTSHDLIIL
jgi:hypothetical protein